MNSEERNFADYCSILYRHKGKMFLFFLLGMSTVIFGIANSTRQYVSEARLHVRMGRESVALDPTATTGQMVGSFQPRKQEINTVMDLLRSRCNIEAVVDKLGADTILASGKSDDVKTESDAATIDIGQWIDKCRELLLAINVADPVSRRERAIRKLAKDISVDSEEESNVISITCCAGTPEFAQCIANEFLEACRAEHVDAYRTDGSLDFFVEQSQQQRDELERAEQQLRDIKSRNGIVTVASRQEVLKDEIAFVETGLLRTGRELASSRARIASLEKTIVQLPELLLAEEKTEASAAADEMRRILYELQVQEEQLSSRYTPDHSLVIAIGKQVEASRQLLENEEKRRVQPTRQLNPARQQQDLALLQEQSVVAAHEAKQSALNRQYAQLTEKLKELNDQEIIVAQLQRKVDLSRESFLDYSRKWEQARINAELERCLISNLKVVQSPNLIERPVKPQKVLILMLGFLASTMGAVGLAFISQYYQDYRASRRQNRNDTSLEDSNRDRATPRTDTRNSDGSDDRYESGRRASVTTAYHNASHKSVSEQNDRLERNDNSTTGVPDNSDRWEDERVDSVLTAHAPLEASDPNQSS